MLSSLHTIAEEIEQVLNTFSKEAINKVPYTNSWTAAQVGEHLTKANDSIVTVFKAPGIPATSDKDKMENLKNRFLNFEHKLQSPALILPEQRLYDKETLMTTLRQSYEEVSSLSKQVNVNEMVTHPVLGSMRKIDMIQFIIYHTQRHIHQLKKIQEAIAV